ncbi:MAG: hypothetical protein Q8M15_14605 [Bacteroidota bacterium]|nr:hypothetical protein [Bacteroidota bacterium]
MVKLEDVFLQIGFNELPPFLGERVFSLNTDWVRIKITHLSVIPSFSYGPGFSVKVNYASNRILQMEPDFIPDSADSYEQALAYIVFGIGSDVGKLSSDENHWHNLGKSFQNLLPWEVEKRKRQEEWEKLPKASIEISWLRVLVLLLKEWRDEIKQNELISFTFNGEFVVFKCGNKTIPIPGSGTKWENTYFIDFSELNNIPIRIFKTGKQFHVNESKLHFGNKTLLIQNKSND